MISENSLCVCARRVLHCAEVGKSRAYTTSGGTRDVCHVAPTPSISALSVSCAVHSFAVTYSYPISDFGEVKCTGAFRSLHAIVSIYHLYMYRLASKYKPTPGKGQEQGQGQGFTDHLYSYSIILTVL
jgi:hypothetical protein